MTDQVETKQITWKDFEVVEESQQTEWIEGEEPVPDEYTEFDFNRDLYARTIARVWEVDPEHIKEGCHSEMSIKELSDRLGANAQHLYEQQFQRPERRGMLILTGTTSEEFQDALYECALESARTGSIFTHIPVVGAPNRIAFSIPASSCEPIAEIAEDEQNVEFYTYTDIRVGAPLCTAFRNPLTICSGDSSNGADDG